jgi:hypothetical protein
MFLIFRIHWGLGFAYMILFASFVGWVREIVRPGVLWFFRDPSDPNFNPLKDIVDVSTHVHFPIPHVVNSTTRSNLHPGMPKDCCCQQ